MTSTHSYGRFLILSKSRIILCLNHVTCIQYNPELQRAIIWLTNGKFVEVMEPQDYDDLVREIVHRDDA